MSETDPIFSLDPVGECYFAALIYGLRLIDEKESDLGVEHGSTVIDCDALVHFVRRKGDVLVHHMNEETEKQSYVKWTEEELRKVALEASSRLGGHEQLQPWHFREAQAAVLPAERRKRTLPTYLIEKLRDIASGSAGSGASRKQSSLMPVGNGAVRRSAPALSDPAVALVPESVAALLSEQIEATLLALNIKALELAAAHLRSRMEPAP